LRRSFGGSNVFSCIGSGPRMNGCSFFASSAIWQLS
jgi:small ligand-binding sensory domain FIST